MGGGRPKEVMKLRYTEAPVIVRMKDASHSQNTKKRNATAASGASKFLGKPEGKEDHPDEERRRTPKGGPRWRESAAWRPERGQVCEKKRKARKRKEKKSIN